MASPACTSAAGRAAGSALRASSSGRGLRLASRTAAPTSCNLCAHGTASPTCNASRDREMWSGRYGQPQLRPFSSSSSAQVQRKADSKDIVRTIKRVPQDGDIPPLHIAPLAAANPALYNVLRPRPRSAYSALAHRLKLVSGLMSGDVKEKRIDLLMQACTDASFGKLVRNTRAELYDRADVGKGRGIVRSEKDQSPAAESIDSQYIRFDPDSHNAALAMVGNSFMGLVAAEVLHLRYPNLPNRILKAAVSAYVGSNTLSEVAAELGIGAQGIVRWDRDATIPADRPGRREMKLRSQDVNADVMRAVTAIVLQEQGLAAARDFIHTHMLTRLIPLLSLIKFNDPKKTLMELCRRNGMERPQSRMLAETGRLSINPIFVVGVWSGQQKLGEGTGSAIRMAEYRAAEDALRRFYMSETPAKDISLPSMTLDPAFASAEASDEPAFQDIWQIGEARARDPSALREPFKPAALGKSEIVFGEKS